MPQSQEELVLTHLREHGDLSPAEGVFLYSIFRLAAVVHRLVNKGWQIETNMKRIVVNGVIRPYARYGFSKAQAASPRKPIKALKKAQPEGIPLPAPTPGSPLKFRLDDQVKVVKKFAERGKHYLLWNELMDSTIGTSATVRYITDSGFIRLSNGWSYKPEALKLVHRKDTKLAEVKQLNDAHIAYYSTAREAGVR